MEKKDLIIKKANENIGALCGFLKSPKNKEYLDYLNNNILSEVINLDLSEKIWYFVNDIKELQLCSCGDHLSFIGFKNGYRTSCGKKECFVKNRKETCIKKYGVDNPKKSKEILEKEQKNIEKKWNGKHYMFDKNVRNKFKNTMVENYGVEWPQQSEEISNKSKETWIENPERELIVKKRKEKFNTNYLENKENIDSKRKQTILENWNGKHYMLDDEIKEKMKKNSNEKWGTDSPFASKEVIDKRVNSYRKRSSVVIGNLLPDNYEYIDHFYNENKTGIVVKLLHDMCGQTFDIHQGYLKLRMKSNIEICLICNPIVHGKSGMELELLDFIKNNYDKEIITNSKSVIPPNELDIYIPDLKLAFEFNGIYWHSDEYKHRLYHLNKTKECISSNIQLIHIWEDDWKYKQNIMKSIILNKLGKTPNKIYARNCEIREIQDNKLIKEFLQINHLQGFVGSKVKIGLFYQDELVSLMIFGNLRKSLGQKTEEGFYELLRFCSKLNTSVVGGSSKLFNYFVNTYKPIEITSYSDNSRSDGGLYKKLGFKFIHNSDPNYYYIIDDIRKHRFNFRKDKLIREGADPSKTEIQIMHEKGIFRIFDCGASKWIFKNIF